MPAADIAELHIRRGVGAGVSDESITQKLSTEGADMLTLAGVNDANLVELSRLGGVKVALRGDTHVDLGPRRPRRRAPATSRSA